MRTWMGKTGLAAALLIALAVAGMGLGTATVEAKDGDRRDRIRFTGWVESMPEGLHGTWVIGGQVVTTSPRTEFDEVDGPLQVGRCAKVDIRGGAVHEIDSEPASDCR